MKEIVPRSSAFENINNYVNECENVDSIKSTDLSKLASVIKIDTPRWTPFSSRERGRLIKDLTDYMSELRGRVQRIIGFANNGFDDIQETIQFNRHNLLINPVLIEDAIKSETLTIGEKRKQIVQCFSQGIDEVRSDPVFISRSEKIEGEYKRDLLKIKESFLKAKTPQEKIKALNALKEVIPLSEKIKIIEKQLKADDTEEGSISIQTENPVNPREWVFDDPSMANKKLMNAFLDLVVVSSDDPDFIHAALFEIPYESIPPQPIRQAFLSLFFQENEEVHEAPAAHKEVLQSIKSNAYKQIPAKLEEWNDLVKKDHNPTIKVLSPQLKNLAERLTEHTNIKVKDYFKAIFSRSIRAKNKEKKDLAVVIPRINELRTAIKQKIPNKAHFKNVKRNCLAIENNQNLPELRRKWRSELGSHIPLEEIDRTLELLSNGSLAGLESLKNRYQIQDEKALIRILALRVSRYPILAAELWLMDSDQKLSPDVKALFKQLNEAKSEVSTFLASRE